MSYHKVDIVQTAIAGFMSVSLSGLSFMDWLAAGEKIISIAASGAALAFVIYKYLRHVRREKRRDRRREDPCSESYKQNKILDAWAVAGKAAWENSNKKWKERIEKTKERMKRIKGKDI